MPVMPDARTMMNGASQGISIFSKIMQSGLVQNATGYLGTPVPYVGSDVKKTRCREAYKNPELQPSWVREKLPTWGNLGGLLAILGGIFLGRMQSDDPEKAGSKFGFLSGILKLGGVLGVLGSIYSHVQGTFVNVNLGEEEQALYVARGDIPIMLKDADFEWAESRGYLRDKGSKYPESMSYNPNESGEILRPIKELWEDKAAIRAFYIGGPGTGKTHTMYHTLDQFRQYAQNRGKTVVIKEVNADVLATGVSKKNLLQQAAEVAKAVDGSTGEQVEQVSSLLSVSTETRFQMVINSFIDFATEGPDDEIRVISIDEIDKIWKLAEGDKGEIDLSKMAFIATRLQKLLECQKVHILMTGNGTVDAMCGIEKLQARGIKDIPAELAGLRSRLLGMQVHMTEATLPTACDMIRKELRGHDGLLSNELKQAITNGSGDPFDTLGLTEVSGFGKYVTTEDHVTKVSPKVFEIENVDPNKLLNALAYTKIHGRIIHRAISKYVSDVRTSGGEINIEGLRKYIQEDSEFIKIKEDQEKINEAKIRELKDKNENNRISNEKIEERLNDPQVKAFISNVVLALGISGVDCRRNLTVTDLKKVLSVLKYSNVSHPGLANSYNNILKFISPENLSKVALDDIRDQVFPLNQDLQAQIKKSKYSSKSNKTEVEDKIRPYDNLQKLKTLLSPTSLKRAALVQHLGDSAKEWVTLLDDSNIFSIDDSGDDLRLLDNQAERILQDFDISQEVERQKVIAGSDPIKELDLWLSNPQVTNSVLSEIGVDDETKMVGKAWANLTAGNNPTHNSRIILKALKEHFKSDIPPAMKKSA